MLRIGVTIDGCRQSPAILSLALVRAKASSDERNDLAVAATNLIREACASVDSLTEGPTAVLLAVAPGYRGTRLKKRREDAAGKLFITPGHLRDEREEPLLEAVADELYGLDSAYRLRHRHRTEAERAPQESGLRIDWYEQHRRYGRLWTPIVALRADLLVMVDWMREIRAEADSVSVRPSGEAPVVADGTGASSAGDVVAAGVVYGVQVDAEWWRHFNERCAQMTWRLAQHSREFVAFVERDGGVFLLADADSEVRAVDALYRVGIYLPFGDANVSWIRRLLADVPHHELDVFMERLFTDTARWAPNFAKWLSWAEDLLASGDITGQPDAESPTLMAEREDEVAETITRVAADEPASTCGKWLAAVEELITLIEADWFRVADWYRAAPSGSPASTA
ncbi:MAG: hypothetical protein WKF96_00725 [Solirubrobacteraceae bacterium]